MDRETFEKQKAFAGEKRPSQKRRCIDHDYRERRMYMLTMVVERAEGSSLGKCTATVTHHKEAPMLHT